MSVQVPAQALADAQAADGELWPLLLAVSYYESSWNPLAVGDNGLSFGYLQFYTAGGLGDGIPQATLLDGPSNMRLGAQYIRSRLSNGASLWDALQPWSVRPQAMALYERMQIEGIEGAGDVPGPRVLGDAKLLLLAGIGIAILIGGL